MYRLSQLAPVLLATVAIAACGGPEDEALDATAETEDELNLGNLSRFRKHRSIYSKYRALGLYNSVLGWPLSGQPERSTPDGIGRYRHYQNGSIYLHPSHGAWEVHGYIRQKWARLGWERSPLGYPKTDEWPTKNSGRYNNFEHGRILWKRGKREAFAVWGAIYNRYRQLGGERGVLGYPRTDETATPDGVGRYNHFDGGSIYWTPRTGAHEVRSRIRQRWAQIGWERRIGFPISSQKSAPIWTGDRYNEFENGIIYQREDTSFAFELGPLLRLTRPEIVNPMIQSFIDNITADEPDAEDFYSSYLGTSGYRIKNGRLQNRRHIIRLGFEVDKALDADIELKLHMLIDYDRDNNRVTVELDKWQATIEGASFVVSAASEEMENKLNPQLHQKRTVIGQCAPGQDPSADRCLPAAAKQGLISVRVMPDGNVHFYAPPAAAGIL